MKSNILIKESIADSFQFYNVNTLQNFVRVDLTELYELFVDTVCSTENMDKLALFKTVIEAINIVIRISPDNLVFEDLVVEAANNAEYTAPIYGKEDRSNELYYDLFYYHSDAMSSILVAYINDLRVDGTIPQHLVPFRWTTVNDSVKLALVEHIEKDDSNDDEDFNYGYAH
jgi:hypothetical protein